MILKFLQLNMYMGSHAENLLAYIKQENFDLLCIQEVSGGEVSHKKINYFEQIKSLGYEGELAVTWRLKNKPMSFFGQATFFKPTFTLLERNEIWLKPYAEITALDRFKSEEFPKAILSTRLEKEGKKFSILNAHLAWSPLAVDTPEKKRQGKIFFDYAKTVSAPYIIAGDFNLQPNTEVIAWFETLGRNLVKEYGITNTLNLRTHRHKAKLSAIEGVAVDYIFVDPSIRVKEFKALRELDLADHLGLYLIYEL